jgi:RNA polymerase sigma-70 factor (ECF subfamily)
MKFKFRNLVNSHQDQVFSLALYILRNRAEAEDVCQETYIKLWQHIATIELDTAKAWLMKVTRNACLDRLRARRELTNVEIVDESASDHQEPSREIVRDQLSHWLRDAIDTLKEPYKSLIVLRDMQQHSYEHIATTLSLNLNQVKSYLFRARQQLRELLAEVEL